MCYETVIGMEVHAELQTSSKMFCACSADIFRARPNTHVCPVCLGMPGSLPVINERAVEYAVMTGLALDCRIASTSVFARKNYTYPDLPKGYQISQYEQPLCANGWLEFRIDDVVRRVGITRVHLEEDTAKLAHVEGHSLIDFNRSGIPLLEIVSEPEIRSPEEARLYLVKLQQTLRYLRVSSADMEKGAMRCEANVSVRPAGSEEFGTKVEIKNLNSFRAVVESLEHEIARQMAVLKASGTLRQVTMGWDEERGETVVQRVKESADDYRYFPEPDLPALDLNQAWIDDVRAGLPELPDEKIARWRDELQLDAQQAQVLAEERDVADYFEAAAAAYAGPPRTMALWISGELFRLLRETETDIHELAVVPQQMGDLLGLIDEGTINVNTAKRVLAEMVAHGGAPAEIVASRGLAQVSDVGELERAIALVLDAHPEEVRAFCTGKSQLLGWLMGQVMRETGGRANPQLVRRLISQELQSRCCG